MGFEMHFTYETDDSTGFNVPESRVQLGELFEVPDLLVRHKVFKSLKAAKAAGFLPPFVEKLREEMGPFLGFRRKREPLFTHWRMKKGINKIVAHVEAGGCVADFLEDDQCSFLVDPEDLEEWVTKWTAVLGEETLSRPDLAQIFLPLSYDYPTPVLNDLDRLQAQAQEAAHRGVQIRLKAWID